MDVKDVDEVLQYEDSKQRDVIKQFFTNPTSLDASKKTIVFSTPSETGTSFFRLFEPMRVMWKHFRNEANFLYTENGLQPNHMKIADLVIMHRAGNLHDHFLSVSKMWPRTEKRPLICHDVDDNEFNLPKTHPMADLWVRSGKDKMSVRAIKNSDIITTTTSKLAKTFSNLRTSSKNVFIHRNMFDWELPQWNLDKEVVRKEMLPDWYDIKDKIIIGWAGLTSHFEDIKRMHATIKYIHDKYPNTYFILAGMALKDSSVEISYDENGNPMYKEKHVEDDNMKYKNRVKSLYSDIDENRIKLFDALPLENYAKFYALFDISLAYIEHNAFNSCKSEIKVVESIKYGAVPIYSNFGGYNDLYNMLPKNLRYENTAISTMTPGKWRESVEYWVKKIMNDNLSVKTMMSKLTEYVGDLYDLNKHAEEKLFFLLEKTEEHCENETNRIALL